MESTTITTKISRTIYEDQPQLVLTFTPEEAYNLLAIGGSSHLERVTLLSKGYRDHNSKQNNEACSNMLAKIFFAANDFHKGLKASK